MGDNGRYVAVASFIYVVPKSIAIVMIGRSLSPLPPLVLLVLVVVAPSAVLWMWSWVNISFVVVHIFVNYIDSLLVPLSSVVRHDRNIVYRPQLIAAPIMMTGMISCLIGGMIIHSLFSTLSVEVTVLGCPVVRFVVVDDTSSILNH